MTQEDKELLLNDLCSRLSYNVKLFVLSWDEREMEYIDNVDVLYSINGDGYIQTVNEDYTFSPEDVKPYLFPLSSMTEEQKQEYTYIVNYISPDDTDNWKEGEFIYVRQVTQLLHFYLINHLDFRGLIPAGLALDATGLNIY